jgi:hypothetical protein
MVQVDFWQMEQEWMVYKTSYDAYNVEKDKYNGFKDEFNKNFLFNVNQKQDFFRSFLEAKRVVPERPCKPTLPITFNGLILQFQPNWF